MTGLARHPTLLHALRWAYRFRALWRWRDKDAKRMERERSRFYEWAWREAAAELGGRAESLGDDLFEIVAGDARTRVCGNFTAIDDPVTLLLARNKPAAYRLLAAAGIPIPRHARYSLANLQPALDLMCQVAGPCVVKPAKDSGGGLGVTTGVERQSQLGPVSAAAAAYSRDLLIEEQVGGDCCRLLYLDGQLLDAIVRRPPAVAGNGRSTIGELVRRENARRLAQGFVACQFLLHRDHDMRLTLARQGLSLRSVPAAGQRVTVKSVVNENSALENETVVDRLCDAVVETGAEAARAVGVRLAGVDVIASDVSLPLEQSGGRIVEVNATPGLYYHYYKRDGMVPVATHVLRALCCPMARA